MQDVRGSNAPRWKSQHSIVQFNYLDAPVDVNCYAYNGRAIYCQASFEEETGVWSGGRIMFIDFGFEMSRQDN